MILEKDFQISPIDNRIYGAFVEHLGRCVYEGIYEPGHPLADEQGFRKDVMEYVRKWNPSVVRYPGGNFVSGFKWEDSIGPVDQRPKRLDLAWKTTETNEIGIHEFYDWTKKVGAKPMYAVNLGTRGALEAKEVVEYCNHASGTYLSDLRIKNGAKDPFDIKLWCLGNEMDHPNQTGQKTAFEYGRLANEAAKMMKRVDDTIETVVCGSTYYYSPTFAEWEFQVLNECYENVDYVSSHIYHGNFTNDTADYLAGASMLDDYLHAVIAACDAVKGKKHEKKTLNVSLDEWNVWYHSVEDDEKIKQQSPWGTALPILQDVYNFEDALMVGMTLISMLRRADRVKIGCMAQLVNVIAPMMTRKGGGIWAQTTFYPLIQASTYGRGISLLPQINCDRYDTLTYTDVEEVKAAAVLNDDGHITIFAVNRNLKDDIAMNLDLRSFGKTEVIEHSVLHHDDFKAVNTEANPNEVVPHNVAPTLEDGAIKLPAASWNMIRIKINQ